jgi:hypothetical protein
MAVFNALLAAANCSVVISARTAIPDMKTKEYSQQSRKYLIKILPKKRRAKIICRSMLSFFFRNGKVLRRTAISN